MIGLQQSRGVKTNRRVSLQTSSLPVVSHGTALQRLGLWRHSKCFARQSSLTENERPQYAKRRVNACFLDNKFFFSFRYNKQLIAQLVGRHEDLFNPENSCLPRATWIFWVEQIFVSPSKLGNKCILSLDPICRLKVYLQRLKCVSFEYVVVDESGRVGLKSLTKGCHFTDCPKWVLSLCVTKFLGAFLVSFSGNFCW